jgi:hypothetical protein
MEAANGDFNKATKAAGNDALQTLVDPCQSLRTQAASRGDNNATFSHTSASKQHAHCNSEKKSVRFADSELNSELNGEVNMETPTRDEMGDTEEALLAATRALGEQTPISGAAGCGPSPVFSVEDFLRSVELDLFSTEGDFSNQVYNAEQRSAIQLVDWGGLVVPGDVEQVNRATSPGRGASGQTHSRPASSP